MRIRSLQSVVCVTFLCAALTVFAAGDKPDAVPRFDIKGYQVEGNTLTETSNDGGCETNVSFTYTFDGKYLTFNYVGNPDDDADCTGRHADFNGVTASTSRARGSDAQGGPRCRRRPSILPAHRRRARRSRPKPVPAGCSGTSLALLPPSTMPG